MSDRRYATTRDFRAALDARLKAAARHQDKTLIQMRQRFVMECYLARVFALPETSWILKGGSGLLVRIPDARYSRDLDLSRMGPVLTCRMA